MWAPLHFYASKIRYNVELVLIKQKLFYLPKSKNSRYLCTIFVILQISLKFEFV